MLDVTKTKDTVLTFPGDVADAFPGTDEQKQLVAWAVARAYEEVFDHVAGLCRQMEGLAHDIEGKRPRPGAAQGAELVCAEQARQFSLSAASWRAAQTIIKDRGHRGEGPA